MCTILVTADMLVTVSDSLYDSTQLCARAYVTQRYVCVMIGIDGLYHKSAM
jgi:hypothetical protein